MDDEEAEVIINRLDEIDDKLIALFDKLGDTIKAIHKTDEKLDIISNIQKKLESIEKTVESKRK